MEPCQFRQGNCIVSWWPRWEPTGFNGALPIQAGKPVRRRLHGGREPAASMEPCQFRQGNQYIKTTLVPISTLQWSPANSGRETYMIQSLRQQYELASMEPCQFRQGNPVHLNLHYTSSPSFNGALPIQAGKPGSTLAPVSGCSSCFNGALPIQAGKLERTFQCPPTLKTLQWSPANSGRET